MKKNGIKKLGKMVRQLQDKQTEENEMKEKQQIANKSGEKTFQSVVNTKINFISTKNNKKHEERRNKNFF